MKKILLFLILITSTLLYAEDKVEVTYKQNENGNYEFYAKNLNIIPYYVLVKFDSLNNLKSDLDLPFSNVIKENTNQQLIFTLSLIDDNSRYSFNMSYSYIAGDPSTAKHDDSYLYILPYEHGTKHKVVQGYNGASTHKSEQAYSIDFDLDIGTKIVASRDGLVVEVKEDSNIGGLGEQFAVYGNYVMIYHEDGSFANYVHLQQNGALVNVGDRVNKGQVIGLSGNTGYSSGPHLHFSVNLPDINASLKSIPVKFYNYDKTAISLEEGEFYYSTIPGMAEYKIITDKNINEKDYENYSKKVNNTGKINLRSEEIDNTLILYISNGYDKKIDITVNLTLTNLSSSKGNSVNLKIDPLSEKYVCILKMINKKESYRYSVNFRYIFN